MLGMLEIERFQVQSEVIQLAAILQDRTKRYAIGPRSHRFTVGVLQNCFDEFACSGLSIRTGYSNTHA